MLVLETALRKPELTRKTQELPPAISPRLITSLSESEIVTFRAPSTLIVLEEENAVKGPDAFVPSPALVTSWPASVISASKVMLTEYSLQFTLLKSAANAIVPENIKAVAREVILIISISFTALPKVRQQVVTGS